jgi:hypothetical protein
MRFLQFHCCIINPKTFPKLKGPRLFFLFFTCLEAHIKGIVYAAISALVERSHRINKIQSNHEKKKIALFLWFWMQNWKRTHEPNIVVYMGNFGFWGEICKTQYFDDSWESKQLLRLLNDILGRKKSNNNGISTSKFTFHAFLYFDLYILERPH